MALTDVWSIDGLDGTELIALDSSGNLSVAGTLAQTGVATFTAESVFSAGLQVVDSQAISFGTGDDSTLAHDGTTGLDWTLAANDTGALVLKDAAGTYFTLDTTTGAVSIDITSRLTITDGVASGTERIVGGRAYTNTAASAAVTNTTTETLFDAQYSIPANTLKVGTRVRIKYQGIATATNSTDTLAVKCYIGGLAGTALITHSATDVDDNDIFCGEVELIVRTIGSGGTFVATTKYNALDQAATAVLQGFIASTAIDTTAAQIIGVSAEWSVASTANSCRLDILSVDIA